jgi:hypothetical protein
VSATAEWRHVLDELASTLDAQRRALESGEPLPAFTPPTDLGPLPHPERARARALLDELRALEVEVAARHAQLDGEIHRLPRVRRAETPPRAPLYIDRRG